MISFYINLKSTIKNFRESLTIIGAAATIVLSLLTCTKGGKRCHIALNAGTITTLALTPAPPAATYSESSQKEKIILEANQGPSVDKKEINAVHTATTQDR
jgi:hypothetical protein